MVPGKLFIMDGSRDGDPTVSQKEVEKKNQKDYNRNTMKNTTITNEIYQVNDSFFHKIFDNLENARDFMERVLPGSLKKKLNLENIEVVDTKYVSNQFQKGFSDIVVKTVLNTKKGKRNPYIFTSFLNTKPKEERRFLSRYSNT